MKWGFVLLVAAALGSTPAPGQVLSVYSEFARIDTQGNVVAPETPREILSPALVRNGFTTFQVVVQVSADTPYVLRIGQNPDNAARVTMYRNVDGHLEPADEPIKGKSTETFWMDVWVDKTDPVRRIKVEPELEVTGKWVIYPMEMRVRENIVPDFPSSTGVTGLADPFAILQSYVCNSKRSPPFPVDITNVPAIHLRNARQDVAMASELSPSAVDELRKWMGGCSARPSSDPEAYLHVRDYFFTPLWMKVARDK